MGPDTWSNILLTYGPNAVLVFLVVVIELKVRSAWRESDINNQSERTFFRRVYGLFWVVVAVVAFVVIFAWWRVNLNRRPQIAGMIQHLSKKEIIDTSFGELYLLRTKNYDKYADYDFMLINKDYKPWSDGAKVNFIIEGSNDTSREPSIYEYSLPILSDFYRNGMNLKRQDDKLYLYHNGQATVLEGGLLSPYAIPGVAMAEPTTTESTWSLIPTAHAQSNVSINDISAGLESPDAIVRRKTRIALSRQDQKVSLPWINGVLADKASSYRMRLGALVALNNMSNLPVEALLPETITAIQNTINDPDDALRNEALALANKYQLVPVIVYEHENLTGSFQAFGPGIYRYDQLRFGNLPNDSASSVHVAKGFAVRLCENEGYGKGGGACEIKRAGDHNLWSVADKVSFIHVHAVKE